MLEDTLKQWLGHGGGRLMRAYLCTLAGEDEALLGRADLDAVLARIRRDTAHFPLLFFLGFKGAQWWLEYGSLLRHGARFSRLPLETRLAVLDRWETTRLGIRQNLYKLLKIVSVTNFMSDPALLEYVGYGDTLRRRKNRPPAGPAPPGLGCRLGEEP